MISTLMCFALFISMISGQYVLYNDEIQGVDILTLIYQSGINFCQKTASESFYLQCSKGNEVPLIVTCTDCMLYIYIISWVHSDVW